MQCYPVKIFLQPSDLMKDTFHYTLKGHVIWLLFLPVATTFSLASSGRCLLFCLLASLDSSWKRRPRQQQQTCCHATFWEKEEKNLKCKCWNRNELRCQNWSVMLSLQRKCWEVKGEWACFVWSSSINTSCSWLGLWKKKKCLFVFLSSSRGM